MAFPQTSVGTSLTTAIQGMKADASRDENVRSYVSEESSAEIPFGVMVAQGSAVDGALKLAATSDKLIGVVVFDQAYAKDTELGDTGLKPKVTLGVMTRGRIWVPVEEAVTPASAVLVRAVASGNEVAGAFRDTADSSDCIDISAWARYLSSTSGAGLVLLEFDVNNRGADVID